MSQTFNMENITLNFNPTYNEIHEACMGVVEVIIPTGLNIHRVVALSRGGLIPGVIMSHALDVPMTPVAYSSSAGNGDNKNHANNLPDIEGLNLLIVDDIVDSGYTMNEIVTHYEGMGKNCYSFSLYAKEAASHIFNPTFRWITIPKGVDDWVVFPFEKNDPT